jgi:hypothetical protein
MLFVFRIKRLDMPAETENVRLRRESDACFTDKYAQVKHVYVAGHESGALFADSDSRQ